MSVFENREEVGRFHHHLDCGLVKSLNEVYFTVPVWCANKFKSFFQSCDGTDGRCGSCEQAVRPTDTILSRVSSGAADCCP